MSLSQMQVFNTYFMPAIIETLAQKIQQFNTASRGALQLSTTSFDGDFLQESFYGAIHSAQRRVDRYASQSAAAATDLTQLKQSSVKVAGGFGPVRFEPAQMTWLNKPTAEGIEVASRNFAEALLSDQLNTAIAALVAAISNQAAATNDVSATGPVTQSVLNGSHAKFGDRSGDLVTQVMDGAMFHKLIGQNLANGQTLYQAANVTVIDVLGKSTIVTDAPALYSAAVASPAAPAKRRVLSLVPGAAVVTDSGNVISNIQTTNGQTRIETTMQVDYSFGLGLKGYSWDESNGGKSPSDAELGTGANWDMIASSIKQTAGVIAIGNDA